jgi:L-2-hydroxyglutarate oxidase LhgO
VQANGKMVDDFVIHHTGSVSHVQNAPSPGATSSLAVAKMIVDEVAQRFDLQPSRLVSVK